MGSAGARVRSECGKRSAGIMTAQENLILTLFAICEVKGVNPAVVTAPAKYRDQQSCSQRRVVVKELAKAGNQNKVIRSICPLDRKTIQRLIK